MSIIIQLTDNISDSIATKLVAIGEAAVKGQAALTQLQSAISSVGNSGLSQLASSADQAAIAEQNLALASAQVKLINEQTATQIARTTIAQVEYAQALQATSFVENAVALSVVDLANAYAKNANELSRNIVIEEQANNTRLRGTALSNSLSTSVVIDQEKITQAKTDTARATKLLDIAEEKRDNTRAQGLVIAEKLLTQEVNTANAREKLDNTSTKGEILARQLESATNGVSASFDRATTAAIGQERAIAQLNTTQNNQKITAQKASGLGATPSSVGISDFAGQTAEIEANVVAVKRLADANKQLISYRIQNEGATLAEIAEEQALNNAMTIGAIKTQTLSIETINLATAKSRATIAAIEEQSASSKANIAATNELIAKQRLIITENNAAKSKLQLEQATQRLSSTQDSARKTTSDLGHSFELTGGVAREFFVIIRELGTGNIRLLEGSFIVLLNRLGYAQTILNALLAPAKALSSVFATPVYDAFGMQIGTVAVKLAVLGGITAAVALTVGILAKALYDNRMDAIQFNNAIALSGNYAGIARSQYEEYAHTIADSTHSSVGQARDSLLLLAQSGKVASKEFVVIGEAAVVMGRLTGEGTEKATKDLLEMVESGASGLRKFDDATHILTVTEREHLNLLDQAKDKAGIAGLAHEGLARFIDRTAQAAQNAKGPFDRLLDTAKEFYETVKKGLADPTKQEQLFSLRTSLKRSENLPGFLRDSSKTAETIKKIGELEAQIHNQTSAPILAGQQNQLAQRAKEDGDFLFQGRKRLRQRNPATGDTYKLEEDLAPLIEIQNRLKSKDYLLAGAISPEKAKEELTQIDQQIKDLRIKDRERKGPKGSSGSKGLTTDQAQENVTDKFNLDIVRHTANLGLDSEAIKINDQITRLADQYLSAVKGPHSKADAVNSLKQAEAHRAQIAAVVRVTEVEKIAAQTVDAMVRPQKDYELTVKAITAAAKEQGFSQDKINILNKEASKILLQKTSILYSYNLEAAKTKELNKVSGRYAGIEGQIADFKNQATAEKPFSDKDAEYVRKTGIEALNATEQTAAWRNILASTTDKAAGLRNNLIGLNRAFEDGTVSQDYFNVEAAKLDAQISLTRLNAKDTSGWDALVIGADQVVVAYKSANEQLAETSQTFMTGVKKGFADSISDAIVNGKSFAQSFSNIFKQLLTTALSTLIQIETQSMLTNGSLQALSGVGGSTSGQGGGLLGLLGKGAAMFNSGTNFAPVEEGLYTIPLGIGRASGGYTGDGPVDEASGHYTHGKEFVVNANATAKNRASLEAMNAGRSSVGSMPNINISVENLGTPQQYQVQQISAGEIRLLAKDEISKSTKDWHDPTSDMSRNFEKNYRAQRNR